MVATTRPGQTLTPARVTLPSGVRLEYVEQGDPAGVPLVLLPGITDSWRSFGTVLPHLPGWIRAIAVTQRGHGGSDHPLSGYGFEDFTRDLAPFIEALDLGPAIVGGHSHGSYVCQRLAMTRPDQVLGLVLTGSASTWRRNPVAREMVESVMLPLVDPIDPAFVREWQATTMLPAGLHEALIADTLRMPARVWHGLGHALLATDFSTDLDKITAPTLIVWGDQDHISPRWQQEMLMSTIRQARLVIYERATHMLHWEQPDRFAAHLTAFAEQLTR